MAEIETSEHRTLPLTRAIAAGDEAAFATFHDAWFASTLVLARSVSRRDEAFALDVVQDVMLAAARRLPALRDSAALGAWMARTTANAVTDRLRAERRRERRERRWREQADDVAGEPWLDLVAGERRAWLAGQLGALSPVDRAIVAARFGDGPSVAAAAAAFGLGEDAAHGRLRRALAQLRRAAAEWWHGG